MARWNLIPKDWLDNNNLETRFRPSNIATQLQRELENLFYKPMNNLLNNNNDFLPQIDFTEDQNAYHINMEIPGVDKKDVEIAIRNNQLEIKGEKKEEKEKKDKN